MDGEPAAGSATDTPRPARLRVGRLEVRPEEQRALWRGAPLELTAQEIGLLGCLAGHGGSVASYRELVQDVWGATCGVDTTVIHSAVRRLRRKLEKAGVDVEIESVRGYGLRIAYEGHELLLTSRPLPAPEPIPTPWPLPAPEPFPTP
ncbi:winged helix-turn-helix domain-containing protein [Streptomyces decoyicus]